MNNPNEFDLFAAPEEDNLHEQLAKGNFEWSNKTTRILGVLVVLVGTLSLGAWYGHHSAASSATPNISALRSAFGARAGAAGGFGGAAGFSGGASGASGCAGGAGSFGTSAAGNISKISGNTVTITVTDPSSLKAGDTVTVRVRPAGVGGAGGPGAAPGALPGASSSSSSSSSSQSSGGSKSSSGSKPSGTSTPKPSVSGGPAGGRGGGMLSNPAFTACMSKEGVTIAAGARPDRTDPKVMAAMQKCFSTLGIAPGGGGGFGGNRAPGASGGSGGATGGSSGASGN